MGFDVRDIPDANIASLPDHLRKRGFDVSVSHEPNRAPAGGILTLVTCRRGVDVQHISWVSLELSLKVRRITIGNQGGWLPWARRRRIQLQHDVTHAIEELGGYWPYPE